MDTKKMRWVSGNSVIEMSYIMPLFFSLFVIIIHTVFYYHDKAIIGGAAAESAVMGAQYVRRYDKNYDIAYNNMGVIYLDDLGRVKQAIDLFKKSIECNPNYALAHFNLARAISITGDKVEAAKLYQVAQDINKITNLEQ